MSLRGNEAEARWHVGKNGLTETEFIQGCLYFFAQGTELYYWSPILSAIPTPRLMLKGQLTAVDEGVGIDSIVGFTTRKQMKDLLHSGLQYWS